MYVVSGSEIKISIASRSLNHREQSAPRNVRGDSATAVKASARPQQIARVSACVEIDPLAFGNITRRNRVGRLGGRTVAAIYLVAVMEDQGNERARLNVLYRCHFQ